MRRIFPASGWLTLARLSLGLASACTDASGLQAGGGSMAPSFDGSAPDADPWVSGNGASDAIPADQICAALAAAICADARRCCTTFAASDAAVADCASQQTAKCQSQLMSLVSDNRSGYRPSQAAAVVTKIRNMGNTCDLGLVDFASARDGLLGMFGGTLTHGSACPPRDLNDGAAVVSCMNNDVCHVAGVGGTMLTGTCDVVRTASQPCVIDLDCDPHQALRCDFNSPVSGNVGGSGEQSLGLHGHCVPRLADGAACVRATECTSLVCQSKSCVSRTANNVYCPV